MSTTKTQDVINFYKNVEEKFSKTRQSPWKGWEECLKYIKNGDKICDLGCGNGRFYAYLLDRGLNIDYTGYDTNEFFLTEAKNKYPTGNFIKKDIFNNLDEITKKFDVIVGFGITHHLPVEIENKWFKSLKNLVNKKESYLILSFWDFTKDKRFKIKSNSKEIQKLGNNEYELDFANTGFKRYFRTYPDISNSLKDFNIINTYISDGRNQDLNTYFIFSDK